MICKILIANKQDIPYLCMKQEKLEEEVFDTNQKFKCIFLYIIAPDEFDNGSVTTSSNGKIILIIASQSMSEEKFAKEIKNGMRDKTLSKSVRTLQIMSIIVGIILIIMCCKDFIIRNSGPIFNNIA